jgi:hypothetical protein
VCEPVDAWASGTPLFRERTTEAGLEGIGATRMNVADIDGDGWPDVIFRRGGPRIDVFDADPPAIHTWVMRNRGDGTFEDVTRGSGLLAVRGEYEHDVGRPIDTLVAGDVDNDGDLDLYTGNDTRTPITWDARTRDDPSDDITVTETSELMLNDGSGVFTLAADDHPLRRLGTTDMPSGAVFFDRDLDGDLDLWLTQGGVPEPRQDLLFEGDGAGGFIDATMAAGLRTAEWMLVGDLNAGRAHTRAWSGVACDLNGDGRMELLSASYGRAPNHLWQDTGDGTYTQRGVESGYAFDDDRGWSDNQFARCACAANRRLPGCADVPTPNIQCPVQANWQHQFDTEAFRLGGNSGATVCADLNNDGHLDLYTTEIKHWWAGSGADGSDVLLNRGEPDVAFVRMPREDIGTAIDHPPFNWDEGHITAGVIDVDNDGAQDIYVGATDYAGNRGLLYRQVSSEPLRYEALSTDDFFEHNRSHGMAVADFDRDGDLDIIVGHSRSRCNPPGDTPCYDTMQVRYFENVFAQGRTWLQLDLRGGDGVNALAVGARVEVTAGGVTQTQEVGGGYGHYGAQRARVLHFGLGDACDAEVRIRWPDAAGTTQRFTVPQGLRYRVDVGSDPVPEVQL